MTRIFFRANCFLVHKSPLIKKVLKIKIFKSFNDLTINCFNRIYIQTLSDLRERLIFYGERMAPNDLAPGYHWQRHLAGELFMKVYNEEY